MSRYPQPIKPPEPQETCQARRTNGAMCGYPAKYIAIEAGRELRICGVHRSGFVRTRLIKG